MATTARVIPLQAPELAHEVRLLHPAEASELLRKARNTAPLDQRQIATYASDMAAGAWKLNGDPLILDREGVLLSGRLRLHACVKAARPFPTLIIRNVDPSHFDTIDSLRRRTVSDIMSIRKERDGRALAAALTVLWRFAHDDLATQTKRASSQALLALLEQNPDIRFSVTASKVATPRVPHGLGAALHYLFSRVDPTKADAFFREVGSKESRGSPVTIMLRRQLDESRGGGSRSQVQLSAITIKAWEAYRTGRSISLIRFGSNEQFPKITGLGGAVRLDGVQHSSVTSPLSSRPALRELQVKVEVVTPERAQEILERNDRNRSIAASVVDRYARDMRNGVWALNGQTIKISDTGRLLDGQHRCAAAVKSKTPFPAIIVEGLQDEVFDTFDLGTRRSISAVLKDRGETNTANLGAVLRQLWLIDNGLITVTNVPPTVSELLATLEAHPMVRDSVKLATKVRDIAPSILLALHYVFRKADERRADEFVERLADGVMLSADSPILKLRDILQEDRANRKGRMGDVERGALIVKAWNAFFYERPIRVLKWQTGGGRRENFPSIAGLPEGEPS